MPDVELDPIQAGIDAAAAALDRDLTAAERQAGFDALVAAGYHDARDTAQRLIRTTRQWLRAERGRLVDARRVTFLEGRRETERERWRRWRSKAQGLYDAIIAEAVAREAAAVAAASLALPPAARTAIAADLTDDATRLRA
ncbi:MAG: hypothetical protein AAF447_27865, partial [Myxococcota bacterium]